MFSKWKSGKSGYLPGDQSGLKAKVRKGYDFLGDVKQHLTTKNNSPFTIPKKKKKKPVEPPKVYEI